LCCEKRNLYVHVHTNLYVGRRLAEQEMHIILAKVFYAALLHDLHVQYGRDDNRKECFRVTR